MANSVASRASTVRRSALNFIEDVRTLSEPGRSAREDQPIGTASIVFNLLQTTMGVGILSLATTMAYAGVVVGAALFLVCGFVARVSAVQLCDGLRITNTGSCETLAEATIGRRGRVWAQGSTLGLCLVAMTAFLVTMKAFIWLVLKQIIHASAWHTFTENGGSKNTLLIAAAICVVFPLSLSRSIDALARTSFFGVSCIMFFVVLTFVYMVQDLPNGVSDLHCNELDSKNTPTDDIALAGTSVGEILSAFSIIGASFCCQFTVYPVWRECRVAETGEAAGQRIVRATTIAMAVVTILYCLTAFGGYSVWREVAPRASSILACYSTSVPSVCACYIGMTITLCCSYPLVLFSARHLVAGFLWPDDDGDLSVAQHAGATFGLTALVTGIACATSSLGTVMSVGSALTTPSVCYLMPSAALLGALRLKEQEDAKGPGGVPAEEHGSFDDSQRAGDAAVHLVSNRTTEADVEPMSSKAGGQALLAFGVFCQVAMLVGAILNLVL